MGKNVATGIPPVRQLLFALGSAGFNLLERLVVLYVPFFFLPPGEYGVHSLVLDGTIGGVITVLGAALIVGRIFDGLADPLIATWSDNSKSPLGRRKIFMLLSGLPLALFAVLIFFPPVPGETSILNGLWLGAMLCFFYFAYTGYVNPYLALISDLGKTEDLRLQMSTKVAVFGLLAVLVVTVGVPGFVSVLLGMGLSLRLSYQYAALTLAGLATILLYAAAYGFKEGKVYPITPRTQGAWASLKATFSHKAFRTFVLGDMLVQYATNIITMGMVYYVIVIFRKPERFMSIVAGAMIGVAFATFPLVNFAARKYGKKTVLIAGVSVLVFCSITFFLLSFNMTGIASHVGLLVLAAAGIPLAVLAILINPTIAQFAREHTLTTGVSQEAMFFAARAIPVKFIIALAGATFAYLISAFGKDVGRPLGVQLSMVVVALAGVGALFFFLRLPNDRVKI